MDNLTVGQRIDVINILQNNAYKFSPSTYIGELRDNGVCDCYFVSACYGVTHDRLRFSPLTAKKVGTLIVKSLKS